METSPHKLFTIGTSTHTRENFCSILRFYGIHLVIDVRRFPTSRFMHFKKETLEPFLTRQGIDYLWMGDTLGGFRSSGYDQYIETDVFKDALRRVEELALTRTVALCCAEKFPWKCHRRFIARELEKRNWNVLHILDRDTLWTPRQKELF